MNHLPRPRFIIIMLLTMLLLSILPSAYGQGVPDQVNDLPVLPVPSTPWDDPYHAWYQAWDKTVMQSFTPTAEELWAVELRLSNLREDFASVVVSVDIREGAWDGPVIGTASASVPYTDWPGTLVRFDFDPPIDITPGSTYVIQVVASAEAAPIYWVGRGDSYPGGIALLWWGEYPGMDFRFITYGPEIGPPIPEFEASIVIMVSVAMMSLLLFKRLPLLIRRP